MKIIRVFMAISVMASTAAQAASVIAIANQETPLPINAELGSIVQLPSAVKTVTPSQSFAIQDIGAGVAESGVKADVRTFLVKPIPGATSEAVTFVLANGRALALRFVPASGAEKFYDISHESSARRGRKGQFLEAEMAMMRAMLVDEGGGFAREIVDPSAENAKVSTDVAGLRFELARVYASSELTGYVLRVENRGASAVDLDPSTLAFARPNRAVLSQLDRTRLEPCPTLSAPSGCRTVLRMIVRGPKPATPLITTLGGATPPFAKGAQAMGGTKE